MKLASRAVAALACLAALACTGDASSRRATGPVVDPPQGLLEQARKLELAGRIDEAVSLLDAHLASRPRTRLVNFAIAQIHNGQGDLDAAVPRYEQELALNPGHAESYRELGRAAEARGALEEALGWYTRLAEREPENWEAFDDTGRLLGKLGRGDEAVEPLERAARLNPAEADPQVELGSLMRQQGRLEDARELLEGALAKDPLHVSGNYNLGLTLKDLGDAEGAKIYLDRFRKLTKRRDEMDYFTRSGPYMLGEELLRAGRIEQALAAYRGAVEMDSSSWPAHLRVGMALAQLERQQEALASLESAYRLRPDEFHTNYWLARTQARLGNAEEAVRHVREAETVRALGPDETISVAMALIDSGSHGEGVELVEAFVRRQPDDSRMWALLAIQSHRQRELDRAVEQYGRAIAIEPGNPTIHVGRAMAELARGNDEPARQVVARIPGPQLERSYRALSDLAGAAEFARLLR